MRHDYSLDGVAFRLRPISDQDVPLVLELRGNQLLNKFVHPVSGRVSDQLAWFVKYYDRPGDYYFVIEHRDSGVAEGLISIYDISQEMRSGEWGRWILRPNSLAAVESAWLIYRCAFELLNLELLICRTVAANEKVVSFHDSCGIRDRQRLPNHFHLGGKFVDAIEHKVVYSTWQVISPTLKRLVDLTARKLCRG